MGTLSDIDWTTGQALNVVLYIHYFILFSSPQPCKDRVISPFYKSQRSWLDSTRSYSLYTAEPEVKWDSQTRVVVVAVMVLGQWH